MTCSETLLTWTPTENMGKFEKNSGGKDKGIQNGKKEILTFSSEKISNTWQVPPQVSTAQNSKLTNKISPQLTTAGLTYYLFTCEIKK